MMKLLCQALRAATVDTFGVVFAVWMILGVPTLGYQSLTGSLNTEGNLLSWCHAGQRQLARAVFHPQQIKRATPVAHADPRESRILETPHAAIWFAAPVSLLGR